MIKSFRLKEPVMLAIQQHAAQLFGGNQTRALEDLMTIATGVGSLSFLTANIGDGNRYQTVEMRNSFILMKRGAKGKYTPHVTYEREFFLHNFVLIDGVLQFVDNFKGEIPHGAVYLNRED